MYVLVYVCETTGMYRGQSSGQFPQGGLELISSAYSQQALCLKQTNTQLSLLSVMVLQQHALQEQSLPKPAAQHNGVRRLWNHRMTTMQPTAQ